MKIDETDSATPLSAATFHVLLALALHDLHGYGVIQEVQKLSEASTASGLAPCTTT